MSRSKSLSMFVMAILWAAPAGSSVSVSAFSYETSQGQTAPVSALAQIHRQAPGAPGSSDATAAATYAALQSKATHVGCGSALNNFQQICNQSRAVSTFTDTITVSNVPNGTPVLVRVTLDLTGTVDGIGGYQYQANAFLQTIGHGIIGSTGGTVVTRDDLSLNDVRIGTTTLFAGTNYVFSGSLDGSVFNRYCAGGSQDCDPSDSDWTMTLVAGAYVRLEILTSGLGGAQILGRQGHDYLAQPVAVGNDARVGPSRLAAWPNPSHGAVDLSLHLAEAAHVDVGVFDVAGRRIATPHRGALPAGTQSLAWDGRDASGRAARGVFFVRAAGRGVQLAQRVLIVR